MLHKRLQHIVDTLPRMFCSRSSIDRDPALAERGVGIWRYDLLQDTSTFDGQPVKNLHVTKSLKSFLKNELAAQEIHPQDLSQAYLEAQLVLSAYNPLGTADSNRWVAQCTCVIVLGKEKYEASHRDMIS